MYCEMLEECVIEDSWTDVIDVRCDSSSCTHLTAVTLSSMLAILRVATCGLKVLDSICSVLKQ